MNETKEVKESSRLQKLESTASELKQELNNILEHAENVKEQLFHTNIDRPKGEKPRS